MFGTNEIVGKRWFKDVETNKLFVTSMFMTLQGEGPFRGEPAFFIRLAKCNLACSFCDTFFDDGEWLTFKEISDRIEETINEFYSSKDIDRPEWTKSGIIYPLVQSPNFDEPELFNDIEMSSYRDVVNTKKKMVLVMTGGEPMLQDNMNAFLEYISKSFDATQIESNGTQACKIPPSEITTLVCSPKCMEKNGKPTKYLTPRKEILERADCLKFVMEANSSSPYATIPDWAHKWAETTGRDIYISPMNVYNNIPLESKKLRLNSNSTSIEERSQIDEVVSFWEPGLLDMDANQINHEYAAEYCMKYGYILNLQIHLYASLA